MNRTGEVSLSPGPEERQDGAEMGLFHSFFLYLLRVISNAARDE